MTPPLGRPFEVNPDEQMIELGPDVEWSGGVVVMASTVPIPDVGTKPALIFRFVRPDGEFYPARVLVCDEDQLLDFKPLIYRAVNAAVRTARDRQ